MVCECVAVIVSGLALIITDKFLQSRFLSYGLDVWGFYNLPPEERKLKGVKDPMCQVFPRIAACDYHRFGTGGDQANVNALCILALNIINDKVFLILWWWLVFLMFFGATKLLFRLLQLYSSRLRFTMLRLRMHRYFKVNETTKRIRHYIYTCSQGDWFVLYQLSKNVNRPFFMDFLGNLSKRQIPSPAINMEVIHPREELLNMMLRPSLAEYQSTEDPVHSDSDDDASYR